MNDIRKYINLMENAERMDEGKNHPIIVVDVQPAYDDGSGLIPSIIEFVSNSTGKVLMFVNAEQDGLTDDTIEDIKMFWEETIGDEIDWDRFEIVDKGYGFFRSWMDNGVEEKTIIKTIRELYRQKVSDSRKLFNGEDSEYYEEKMKEFLGDEYEDWMLYEPLMVEWTSVSQLKDFNSSYIVGGGRNECLREVELLMNAFNIKYKRVDEYVYG